MNFYSLLDQLHEKMGQQTHVVMFSERDITHLYMHIHALSMHRDGTDKHDIETDYTI
jgi:hypothetical protein